jgi:hypothetical protein
MHRVKRRKVLVMAPSSFFGGLFGKAKADARRFTTMDALKAEVTARLRKDTRLTSIEPAIDDPQSLEIAFGEWRLLLFLGNLLGNLEGMNATEESAEIDRFLNVVLDQTDELDAPVNFEAVYIAIRSLDSVAHRPLREDDGEQAQGSARLCQQLAGDVVEDYAEKIPGGQRFVRASQLNGMSRSELRQRAVDNLQTLLPQLTDTLGMTASNPALNIKDALIASRFVLSDDADFTAGLLLVDGFWAELDRRFPDGVYVAISHHDRILAVSRMLPNALATAQTLLEGEQKDDPAYLLSDMIFERRDGKLAVVAN